MKKSKNLLLLLLAMLSAVWGAGLSWSWEFPVGESLPEVELPHAQAYQITNDIVHSAQSHGSVAPELAQYSTQAHQDYYYYLTMSAAGPHAPVTIDPSDPRS